MKKIIAALLFTVSALTASAQKGKDGNEGPQAILPQSPAIAQVITSGGLFASFYETVEILADGTVQMKKMVNGQNIVIQNLATLAPSVLDKVKTIVESTQKGKLVDNDPSAPGCMDAPSITYYSIKSNGQKIAIAGKVNCKDYERPYNQGDYQLKSILDGLKSLAQVL